MRIMKNMKKSKLKKLILEAKTSILQTPEERILTAFTNLELALEIRDAAKSISRNMNES